MPDMLIHFSTVSLVLQDYFVKNPEWDYAVIRKKIRKNQFGFNMYTIFTCMFTSCHLANKTLMKAHTFPEGPEKCVLLLNRNTELVGRLEQLGENELQHFR